MRALPTSSPSPAGRSIRAIRPPRTRSRHGTPPLLMIHGGLMPFEHPQNARSSPSTPRVRALLEETGHAPVGERLALGLARRAVLQGLRREGHLAHLVTAPRAGQP